MGTLVGADSAAGNTADLAGLTWPVTAADDLAVLAWTVSTAVTPTTPAGWILVATDDDETARNLLLERVCDGAESGDVPLVVSALTKQTAVLSVVRGYSGIDVHNVRIETSGSTTHDCPSVTPTVADAGIIVTSCERLSNGTTTATPPAGYTRRDEAFETGGGATYTGLADDGLNVTRSAGIPVDPASWTHDVSDDSVITRTIALTPTGGGSVALTVESATHAHTISSPTLTQHHALTIDGATHVHTVSSPTLTQHHTLTIESATHAHATSSPTLTQHQTLTVDNATHAHAASSPTLTQRYALMVASATHLHAASSPTLTQHHTLTVDGATHAHAAASPTLTQHHVLTVDSAAHAHAATSPTVAPVGAFIPAANPTVTDVTYSTTVTNLTYSTTVTNIPHTTTVRNLED